jgi:hypothetical protein
VARVRVEALQKLKLRNHDGGMFETTPLGARAPRHDSRFDSRQAVKQIVILKYIAEQSLRPRTYHQRRHTLTIGSFGSDSKPSRTQQVRAAGSRNSAASNDDFHPGLTRPQACQMSNAQPQSPRAPQE